MDTYLTVYAAGPDSPYSNDSRDTYVVAEGIASALRDAGPLLGLAAIIYLLAGLRAHRQPAGPAA